MFFLFLMLSCTYYIVYTKQDQSSDELPTALDASQALSLWTQFVNSFNTSSYVYKLQKYCAECDECDSKSKYIAINNNLITNVQYVDTNSECLSDAPLNIYSYKTIPQWFQYSQKSECQTIYDDTYGFPKTITYSHDNAIGTTVQILCVSFHPMSIKNVIALNQLDTEHCSQHKTDNFNANNFDKVQLNASNSTACKNKIIEREDCTEWLYVYITTGLSVILSVLSILCSWLYYRQGINPATKGYKRSQGSDFVINEDDSDSDSDSVQLHGDNIIKHKKKRKKKNKLLGIDENEVLPKIKIKKNMQNKYGSVAQTDEEERSDNPFDMDPDSEKSDEWHFVGDNKGNAAANIPNNDNPFGGSQSDQTDEEEN